MRRTSSAIGWPSSTREQIKALGSPAELKIGLGGDIVSLTLKDQTKIPTLVTALTGQPAMRAVKATPTGLDIRVDSPEKALPAILESANRLDCRLEFIEYHRPRLDDVFIAHTGRSMTRIGPKTFRTGIRRDGGAVLAGNSCVDDAVGPAAQPREIQYVVHARAADAVLADLLRQPVPAGRGCASDAGSRTTSAS